MKSLLEEIFVASEMPTTTGVNTCNCQKCQSQAAAKQQESEIPWWAALSPGSPGPAVMNQALAAIERSRRPVTKMKMFSRQQRFSSPATPAATGTATGVATGVAAMKYFPVQKLDTVPLPPSWANASADLLTFRKKVYLKHVERSSSKRSFIGSVPFNQLTTVEGKQIRKEVADPLRQLLQAVRADGKSVGRISVNIGSGYRDAEVQFISWATYFFQYYTRAIKAGVLSKNDYSDKAATNLSFFIGKRLGAPGFSNHQDGKAIDFHTVENGKDFPVSTSSANISHWRANSWVYQWLLKNAARFGFKPYAFEPWHWEYRP